MKAEPTKFIKNDSEKALWIGILASLIFTGTIWLTAPLIPQIDFLPDAGASWYYWKLPEPTVWTRTAVWAGYLLHQLVAWGIIYYAQQNKLKYTKGLHRANYVALAANGFFIMLHIIQTQIWFDGLAQDVSIWSSQASVVIMLVLILLMENQRRGLFFGKKVKVLNEPASFIRKYHGYIFSWGIIYTFWYHPTVATGGHLIGFLYTFLLMLQGSLFFTRAHVNKYWTFAMEIAVLFHGTLVAVNQGNGIWPMFFFGFAALFIVTQMYGLGLGRWTRWGFIASYIVAVLVVYSSRGWEMLNEIIRIPVIEYALVFVFALFIWLGMVLVNQIRRLFFSTRQGMKTTGA